VVGTILLYLEHLRESLKEVGELGSILGRNMEEGITKTKMGAAGEEGKAKGT